MKTLLILRHAKSSWDNDQLSDYERPLNNRGKQDAPRMGELLREQDLLPDLIITSSAARALATAEAAAEASGYEQEIRYTRNFYHAGPEEYINTLQQLDDSFGRVMVVGHNPGMEMLVDELTGLWERMPTAALAQVILPINHWHEFGEGTTGKLVNLWRPKELG